MAKKPRYEDLEQKKGQGLEAETVERNRAERAQRESEGPIIAKKLVTFISGILILFGVYLNYLNKNGLTLEFRKRLE